MLYFKLEDIKSDQDLMKIISKIKDSLSKIEDHKDKIMIISIKEINTDSSDIKLLSNN